MLARLQTPLAIVAICAKSSLTFDTEGFSFCLPLLSNLLLPSFLAR